MDGIWIEVILIGVAIIANGFFAGSELALVSARPSRLAELRGKGISGAAVAEALKREPERFLATIQIAITLVGTLASAVGGAAAVDALQPWLASLGVPGAPRWSGPVALGLVVLLITFFSLVLGELTPKALALRNPAAWAAGVARPIAWLVRVLAAPGRTLTWSTRIVLTLIGQRDTPPAPLVSEEEVKYLVREGASQGVFETQESDLVHRVFQFTDTAVRHVMAPRPNIRALDIDTPPEQVLKRAAELGHTRLPVYRGSLEETVGVVVIKDLFRCAAEGTTPVLERLVHAPIFVPETTQVSDVLRTFQRSRQHLALVVDEYGQVVGLVTTEDLLEEIVGEIRDEGESPRLESVTRLPGGSYIIDGTATIRDLREQVGLPLDDSPDYQTVAGFILNRLGVVPRPGATLHAAGHHWTVLDMEGPRIMKVKADPGASLMPLFDTHAHLHFPELLADLDSVLERARAAGVTGMVTIGTDRETNPAAVALAERLPDVYATVGIHPHDAGEATQADFEAMERLARGSAKVVALGEMGLDFFRNLSPRDAQETALRRQLDMARRLGKPVVIHCRDAHREALAILSAEHVGEVGGVMHCFSADVEVAKRCLDLGLMISLAGPVTYKNARALPDVARFVPADRLVVETDCPFLPPHPHRGQRNEPAWVAITAAHVAGLRGVAPEALGETVTENAHRLFQIPTR